MIKDVPKTLVYQLARYRNEHGSPRNAIPQSVIEKAPSAELSPTRLTRTPCLPTISSTGFSGPT